MSSSPFHHTPIDITTCPSYYASHSTLPETATYHQYSITSLNVPGRLPHFPGPSPFTSPYAHRYTMMVLDHDGSLGLHEYARFPQAYVPHRTPIHRLFIEPEIAGLERFDRYAHAYRHRGVARDVVCLNADFLSRMCRHHYGILSAHARYIKVFNALQLVPVSDVNTS